MKLCSHFGLFALAAALLIAGCGSPPDTVEVTKTIERSAFRPPVEVNAPSEERFKLAIPTQSPAGPMQTARQPAGDQEQLFHWQMPEGWTELPPTSMRLINLRFGAQGESEAYLSFLTDGGGGVAANLNRWRTQMGHAPISDAEIAALPTKPLFGRDATFIDIEGTYTGMADPSPKEGYRLMGVLLEHGGQGIFLKVVGPKADMEGQEANVDLLLSTIHLNTDGHSHGDAPQVTPNAPPAADSAPSPSMEPAPSAQPAHSDQELGWTAPESWTRAPDRPMRLVTFTVGGVECYITVLGPGGGGLLPNLNRWLGQFGKPPIDDAGLAALPTVALLGEPAPVLEAEGDFTGMDGVAQSGQRMLAVARILPDKSVFIKMTGPSAEVESQRGAFFAFCESLRAH